MDKIKIDVSLLTETTRNSQNILWLICANYSRRLPHEVGLSIEDKTRHIREGHSDFMSVTCAMSELDVLLQYESTDQCLVDDESGLFLVEQD